MVTRKKAPPEIVSTSKTYDNFVVQLWSDGMITDRMGKYNKGHKLPAKDMWRYWNDVSVYNWKEIPDLVAKARKTTARRDPTSYRPRPLFPGMPTTSRISGKRRIRWYGDLDFLPPSVVNLTAVHNAKTKKDLLKAGLPDAVIETLKESTGSSDPRRIAGHFIFLADRGVF